MPRLNIIITVTFYGNVETNEIGLHNRHNQDVSSNLMEAKIQMKNMEKMICDQNQEMKTLHQQLDYVIRGDTHELFMSMKSHRLNYQTLIQHKEINLDLKEVEK